MARKHPGVFQGADSSDRYFELVHQFQLRPIRWDDELARAIDVVNSLVDQGELSVDEEDYLEVLEDLIEKYEAEDYPTPRASAADMLRHLIEVKGTTEAEVAAATGIAISTFTEILQGQRSLNRRQIRALARLFQVSPADFAGA
jgi:HTH-type transcriptional regulator/antitoxin HigA